MRVWCTFERMISGARYSGVPHRVHVRPLILFANPKSVIYMLEGWEVGASGGWSEWGLERVGVGASGGWVGQNRVREGQKAEVDTKGGTQVWAVLHTRPQLKLAGCSTKR